MRAGPAFFLLAGLAASSLAVIGLVWQGSVPYRGYDGEAAVVTIPAGLPAAAVGQTLEQAGVIRSSLLFRILVRVRGEAGRLHAGEYEFRGQQTPGQVVERLVRGDVLRHKLTLPEGLRIDEIADLVQARGLGDRGEFLAAASDPALMADRDPLATDLEGYLFPDTYFFARGLPAGRLVAEMVTRFREELTPERLGRMKQMGLSLRQTVTLASLIEEEARVEDERERISAVFHNRLDRGMLLQCDPTVVYALIRDDRYRGDIYRSDLAYDSPYNTYVSPGLPPGPISNPGGRSLDAALHPAATDDLYFVVSGSGRHTFSSSLRDHEAAVRRYRQNLRMGRMP